MAFSYMRIVIYFMFHQISLYPFLFSIKSPDIMFIDFDIYLRALICVNESIHGEKKYIVSRLHNTIYVVCFE